MKLRLFHLMTALMIVSLILAGCQQQGQAIPSDPVEAVKLIADKQKEIKSQHFDLTLDLNLKIDGLGDDDPTAAFLKDFDASVEAQGDVDTASENFQLTGSADLGVLTAFLAQGEDKLAFELIKVGNTMYTRGAGQEEWSESDVASATGSEEAANISPEQLTELLKKVARAERLGDESIDGVDTFHFKLNLDPEELINEIVKMAEASGAEAADPEQVEQAKQLLKDAVIDVELWVGKADLLIRQQKFHFVVDLKEIPDAPPEATVHADLGLTFKSSKINEPVNITAPK
jgi:hypothetical protein